MATLIPSRPEANEYGPSYASYMALATEGDILAALSTQLDETLSLLSGLSEATANTRHAPYTWSVKQVVGHVTDADREFGHRAFRFSRGDPTPLPGFDENVYVDNAPFDASPLSDLLDEFEHVRRANLSFFRRLPAEAWLRSGVASNNPVTVRALAYIIVGHTRHHVNILRKRLGRD
jgi:DinB superfamily